MKKLKPNFNFAPLYEIKDQLQALLAQEDENTPQSEDLIEQLETLTTTIRYLEIMDKDRIATNYAYELTYSQPLVERINRKGLWQNLSKLHYRLIGDCDWDDEIPTYAKIQDVEIRVNIDIDDKEKILQIYLTLL